MNRVFGVVLLAVMVMAYSAPARADSDLEVRCFVPGHDDEGLVQSYTAEWCEEIGDSVPYFSLGRMISPATIYEASYDLHCLDKPKAKCIKCLNDWRRNYRELLASMVKGKLISSQNRMWMLSALAPFYDELKSGCD